MTGQIRVNEIEFEIEKILEEINHKGDYFF